MTKEAIALTYQTFNPHRFVGGNLLFNEFGLLSRGTFFDWEKPHTQGLENALFMGLAVHNLNYYDISV